MVSSIASRSGQRRSSTLMKRVSTGMSWKVASQDHAGESHAADGRPEHVGRPVGGHRERLATAGEQRDRQHLVAERPVPVVPFAVDVARDRTADGDEARPGRDQEPAPGHEPVHEVLQARPGARGDDAALEIRGDDPRERGGIEDEAAGVLSRVAVRATEPAGDDAPSGRGAEQRTRVRLVERRGHVRARRRRAAPTVEEHLVPGQRTGFRRHTDRPPRRRPTARRAPAADGPSGRRPPARRPARAR